jgi:hypothetical protein
MTQTANLSRLMRISWDIQKNKRKTRSKALTQAWAIFNNEDIAVQHLTRRLNHNKPVSNRSVAQYSLFTH